MREPLEIGRAGRRVCQRVEGLSMQQQPPVWRERLFDGAAGELVPECDATRAVREHPRRQTFVELVDSVAGECFE